MLAGLKKNWWQRHGLLYSAGNQLEFDNVILSDLARREGTPLFAYSVGRICQNVDRLRSALAEIACETRLLYALKANRHETIIRLLTGLKLGFDTCSPEEVRYLLEQKVEIDQLSFTAGCLSRSDYEALAAWPDLWVNVDSLTAIRRLGELSPGREIGIRINPAVGLGYGDNPMVQYSGKHTTKFGIHSDSFSEAINLARKYKLRITGLHCHAGSGFLTPQLKSLEKVLQKISSFIKYFPEVREINLGGGLGVPLTQTDGPLDLQKWSSLVNKYFGRGNPTVAIEPGDYLVKDAGVLVTEINQVEEKGGVTFVGVNAGFNIHPEPAFYDLPLEPVPTLLREGGIRNVTVAGNINEAHDLWAKDFPMPPVYEDDYLAFLNAGAYGASMASKHCLRHQFREIFIDGSEMDYTDTENRIAWNQLYNSTSELVWGCKPLPFLHQFSDFIRPWLREPVRLLDAGTGEGRNLPFLLSFGDSEITALDSSPAALAKIPLPLKAKVIPREGLLSSTSLPRDYFDAIIFLDVAETLPSLQKALAEMFAILKPGGVILINFAAEEDGIAGVDMSPSEIHSGYLYKERFFYRFFSLTAALQEMEKVGFCILEAHSCNWEEDQHPGYRDENHQHLSHVLLGQRPLVS